MDFFNFQNRLFIMDFQNELLKMDFLKMDFLKWIFLKFMFF